MPLRDVLSSPSLAASYNVPLLDTKKQTTGVSPCLGAAVPSLPSLPLKLPPWYEVRSSLFPTPPGLRGEPTSGVPMWAAAFCPASPPRGHR